MIIQDFTGVDLRGFQGFLKVCRKQGVSEISLGGVVIKFGDLPARKAKDSEDDDKDDVATDGLTEEQLMFFSAPSAEGT